jgi:LuxR family transcriptional regulator, maltose regulon positive regulatory protein
LPEPGRNRPSAPCPGSHPGGHPYAPFGEGTPRCHQACHRGHQLVGADGESGVRLLEAAAHRAQIMAFQVRPCECDERRGVRVLDRLQRPVGRDGRCRFAAESFLTPAPVLLQGIARVLCGDLGGGDESLKEAVSVGEEVGAHEDRALALCERSLVAIARRDWDQAEVLADQARTVLREARIEESYAAPLVSAAQARTAMHRGDVPAARQQLVRAQRLRPLLTYALPYFAVQARIELMRVHLALADLAGARTLMREVDELLRRRPGLGTLAGEAEGLRARLSKERGSSAPGASALTDAELRLLPMLPTHLSFPEIAGELFLSPHTVKSEANSLYRKLGASTRSQAVTRSRELGLLEG